MVSEVIIQQFRKAGVKVLTSEGVDLTAPDDDPTKTLIRQVLSSVAQFEKTVLVLKLRAARVRIRKKTGRCEGAKGYGTYPGEVAIVERMRRMRRKPVKGQRASFADIAATLNSEGFKNRAGREWSTRMVFHVLNQRKGA